MINKFVISVFISLLLTVFGLNKSFAALPVTNGMILHLDASDTNTITAADGVLNDGDKISAWGSALQSNSSLMPVWVAHMSAFNNKAVMQFSGTIMTISSLVMEQNITVFFVSQNYPQSTVSSSSLRPLLAATSDPFKGTASGYGLAYNKGDAPNYVIDIGNGSAEEKLMPATGTVQYDSAARIIIFRRNGNTSNGSELYERKMSQDSAQLLTRRTMTRISGFYTGGYYLGGEPSVSCRYYTGGVGEVIIYNRVLSDTEMTQVSDYLYNKYFLTVPTTCGSPGTVYLPTDVDKNCRVDFRDFALIAANYLKCTNPQDPNCDQYWNGPGPDVLASRRWHQWRQLWTNQFPTASWAYFSKYSGSLAEYTMYKNAGLTMVQVPLSSISYNTYQCNNAMAAGLKILLGGWESIYEPSKLNILQYYISYPSANDTRMTGYQLKDEPNSTLLDKLGTASYYIYQHDTRASIPIISMLPNWAVSYSRFGMSYTDFVDAFVTKSYPAVMLSTHYPNLADGTDRPEYYDNFELFRNRALSHNIGLMAFVNLTQYDNGKMAYRAASESDIYWQVYSGIAYGAQGIWYYNYRIGNDPKFGEGLVMHADGSPNPQFYPYVQAANNELHKLSPILMKLKSQGVWHTGTNLPSGTTGYTNGVVTGITGFTANDFIIGQFNNQDDSSDTTIYLMIVNKLHAAGTLSSALPASTTITVNSSYPYVYKYNPSTGDMEQLTGTDGNYTITLDGGHGLLIRLSQTSLR